MATRLTRSRKQPPSQQQEPQSRAKWTTSLTKILVDLMVDQVHKGNRQKNSFTKKAWKFMCDEFHKKTGLKWDKEQLKNRFSVLRRQYVTVKSLLDQGDFCWDESEGSIIATDEAWVKYIEEHPDAENIRSAGCPIYKDLCTIFSEPAINGKSNQSAEYEEGTLPCMPPCPEPLSMMREDSSSESDEVDGTADDVLASAVMEMASAPSAAGSRKRGRKGVDDVIASAIMEMASASKLRTDVIRQRNARFSISDCVKELDELQGVDEEAYFAALDLFDNPIAREVFLSLKADKRLTWLNGKLLLHLIP